MLTERVLLSEADSQRYAASVIEDLLEYNRLGSTKRVEKTILDLRPRVRAILAQKMPVSLFIWVASVSPAVREALDESLNEAKKTT